VVGEQGLSKCEPLVTAREELLLGRSLFVGSFWLMSSIEWTSSELARWSCPVALVAGLSGRRTGLARWSALVRKRRGVRIAASGRSPSCVGLSSRWSQTWRGATLLVVRGVRVQGGRSWAAEAARMRLRAGSGGTPPRGPLRKQVPAVTLAGRHQQKPLSQRGRA
jgi:hypothetical protein